MTIKTSAVTLDDRQAAICRRFREIRMRAKWRMPEFAKELGISRDRLASYEYARAPIRYWLGRCACERFDVNQRWLATGILPSFRYVDVEILEADILENDLFTEGYLNIQQIVSDRILRWAQANHCGEDDLEKIFAEGVNADLPMDTPEDLAQYHSRLLKIRLHKRPIGVQKKIFQQLNSVLDQAAEHTSQKAKVDNLAKNLEKGNLTDAETSANPVSVKAQLPSLLDDLKKATQEPGQKSALAKKLGVPLASVSRWLSGEREPGGEIALQLRAWVDDWNRRSK